MRRIPPDEAIMLSNRNEATYFEAIKSTDFFRINQLKPSLLNGRFGTDILHMVLNFVS